jgi:hypothetical protein
LREDSGCLPPNVCLFCLSCLSCHLLARAITTAQCNAHSLVSEHMLCAPEHVSIQFPHCHRIHHMLCTDGDYRTLSRDLYSIVLIVSL